MLKALFFSLLHRKIFLVKSDFTEAKYQRNAVKLAPFHVSQRSRHSKSQSRLRLKIKCPRLVSVSKNSWKAIGLDLGLKASALLMCMRNQVFSSDMSVTVSTRHTNYLLKLSEYYNKCPNLENYVNVKLYQK